MHLASRILTRTRVAALVRKQGYTIVTLPVSADRPTNTHVEVYSQAMTLAQIKALVRGLVPVA